MSCTFKVVAGSAAEEPVKFLSLGYYKEYEFVKDYPVYLPLYITGPVTYCYSAGDDIPGLTFSLAGLQGTPTTVNLTVFTLRMMCRNEVSVSNEVVIKAMVHSAGKKGLMGNFWKWSRYTPAFPCNDRINPFVTPGVKLEVQKPVDSISINGDSYFNFFPDFKEFYGVMFTGYINIPQSRSYVFSSLSTIGSYIEIDDELILNHAQSCHGQEERASSPVELTMGYHRITLGYSKRKSTEATKALFYWRKDGSTKIEISMDDLTYVPMNTLSYEKTIYAYQKKDPGIPMENRLMIYEDSIKISNCKVEPENLPDGIKLDASSGGLSGTPTKVTDFADFIYVLTCDTNLKDTKISHQFEIEVRDFDKLPSIPYVMLKRSPGRTIPVKPDMYFQFGWVIDNSCYPNGPNFLFKLIPAPDSRVPSVCASSGRGIKCTIDVSKRTTFLANFDAGSEYDQAFQIYGTVFDTFDKSTALLQVAIGGDDARSAVLKISFTYTETTPIPGWAYFGIWTMQYGLSNQELAMPLAPKGASGKCCNFKLMDRNNIEILAMNGGFVDWMLRQGLLLEPNLYTLYLESLHRTDTPSCVGGADYNITIDNTWTYYHIDYLKSITFPFRIQRMECSADESAGLPATAVGGFVEFSCGEDQYGTRIRQCKLDKGGFPFWASEVSTCDTYKEITTFYYDVQYISLPINTKMILSPTVVGDYDSFQFEGDIVDKLKYDSKTGVIELESTVLDSTLNTLTISVIQKKSGGSKVNTTLKYVFNNTKADKFEPIMGLRMKPTNVFSFPKDARVSFKFISIGVIDGCIFDPKLPVGMISRIDSFSGIVNPEVPIDTKEVTYSVECHNDHSRSNKLLFYAAVISSVKMNYIKASFWIPRVQDTLDCAVKHDPFYNSDLIRTLEKFDSRINNPFTENGKWFGLGPKFSDYWGVEYTGFFQINSIEPYTFSVKAQHGVWIEIDDDEVISTTGCTLFENTTYKSVSIDKSVGLYPIRILYFHNRGGSGLEISYRVGSSVSQLLDIKTLGYAEPTIFGYNNTISNYVIGEEIEENKPYCLSSNSPYSYEINPKLEEGLIFNTGTGVISGTPRSSTGDVIKSYTITGKANDGVVYKTSIYMEIADFNLPYNVRFVKGNDKLPTTSITIVRGESVIVRTEHDGNSTSFMLMSSEIDGFTLNSATGVYSGVYRVIIAAVNQAGKSRGTFSFTCSDDCPDGQEQFLLTLTNYAQIKKGITVNLLDGESKDRILGANFDNNNLQPIAGGCILVNKNYIVSGINYDKTDYFAEISMSSHPFMNQTIQAWNGVGVSGLYEFQLYFVLNPPVIRYPKNSYVFTIPERIHILADVENIISDCQTNDTLPSGIELNRKTCEINGVATAILTPAKNYLITPKNGGGSGIPIVLALEVMDCNRDSKVAYSIIYNSGADPAKVLWEFQTKDSLTVELNNVDTHNKPNTEYFFAGCVVSTDYQILMTNPSRTADPWPEGAYVTIQITGMSSFTFRKTNTEREEIQIMQIDLIISSGAAWKMRADKYSNANWFKLSYSQLDGFKEYSLGNAPEFVDATLYMATEFSPADIDQYAAFATFIQHKMGFILYLNGIEFYRKFLPETDVKYDTLASDEYSEPKDIQLVLPSLHLKDGRNTLSIEVHRKALTTDTKKLLFSLHGSKITELEDGCLYISKSNYSNLGDHSGNTYSDFKPENALDYNVNTKWWVASDLSGMPTKAWLTVVLKPEHYGWFNQIGWRTVSDLNSAGMDYQPTRIKISGLSNGKWYELDNYNNIIVRTEMQRFSYHHMENTKLFTAFNFTIDGTKGINKDMQIADVFVGACQKYYCDSNDGFPATSSGTRVSTQCPPGLVGTMFRQCGEGKNPSWGEADTSRCRLSPPTNLKYPESAYYLVTYQPLTADIRPTVSFIGSLVYEINPKLPDGLSFNNATGEISGSPLVRIEKTPFSVRATDPLSSIGVEAILDMEITSNFCPNDGQYQTSMGGTRFNISCGTGFSGSKFRICHDGVTPSWGEEVDECIDKRNLSTGNIILISVLSVCSLIAVGAISLCLYGKYKASKRKGSRMQNKVVTGSRDAVSMRNTQSRKNQKSVRI